MLIYMSVSSGSNPKLYVGITCIPGREGHFDKCLGALKNQKKLPEKVFISYCKNYNRFPDKNFDKNLISKYKNDPLFEFIECEDDKGPATKFLAPWERIKVYEKGNYENTYLIVGDDDKEYYNYFIENFHKIIREDPNSVFTGYIEILNKSKNFSLAFGADGYNIKASWYDKLINWYNIITSIPGDGKEIFFHDDYIFSSFLHYNKIPIKSTRMRSYQHNWNDEFSLTTRMKKNHDDRGTRRNGKCWGAYNKVLLHLETGKDDPSKYKI